MTTYRVFTKSEPPAYFDCVVSYPLTIFLGNCRIEGGVLSEKAFIPWSEIKLIVEISVEGGGQVGGQVVPMRPVA